MAEKTTKLDCFKIIENHITKTGKRTINAKEIKESANQLNLKNRRYATHLKDYKLIKKSKNQPYRKPTEYNIIPFL